MKDPHLVLPGRLCVAVALVVTVGCETGGGEETAPPDLTADVTVSGNGAGDPSSVGDVPGGASATDATLSEADAGEGVLWDTSGPPGPIADASDGAGQCKEDADCEDLDPCTLDVCDQLSFDCLHTPDLSNPNCQDPGDQPSGANPPCQTSDQPGSSDPAVTSCVCALDKYCCDTMWDEICVDQADLDCGVACSCDEVGADISCTGDLDCEKCNVGNPCTGNWSCQAGECVVGDAVECPPSEIGGCVVNQCDPWTGECAVMDDESCADGDPCTVDTCDMSTGGCSNDLACGVNHPCESSPYPTSKDEGVTACVCGGSTADDDGDGQPDFEGDSWCCDNGWDSLCVNEAETYCGAICDCTDPSVDLGCADDGHCTWCGGDVCQGLWTCHDGYCGVDPGLACPASEDVGCLMNTCNPFDETCELIPSKEECDDYEACTVDHCNVETGQCSYEQLSGCTGEPPYECLGYGEISAEGCDYVETLEGCCDPWGRAIWCNQVGVCTGGLCLTGGEAPPPSCADPAECADPGADCVDGYCLPTGSKAKKACTQEADCGTTMCVDCAGTDPYCGWTGTWYLCGTEGVASEEPQYPAQCPGLTYAE